MPGIDTSLGFITKQVDDIAWLCEKTIGKTLSYNPMVNHPWNTQLYQEAKLSKKKVSLLTLGKYQEMALAPAVKNVLD